MVQTVHVRLREGSPHTAVDMATLTEEIVHGATIGPDAQLLVGDRWLPLRDHVDAPWRDVMLTAVDRLVRQGDGERAEQLAQRVLRFCPGEDLPDARRALFFLGVLRAASLQWAESAALLQRAAAGDSVCLAAARNNLAVVAAMLRDPIAAVAHVLAARRDSRLVTPLLTQRNLARVMLRERAHSIPGRPSWRELCADAEAQLKRRTPEELRRAADPRRPFPSHHVLLVFEQDDYVPEISSRLAPPATGLRAAANLADEAAEALRQGDFERAIRLAEGAQQLHASVGDQVRPVLTTARIKVEERRTLTTATDYADRLRDFFRQLDELSLDRLDAPRESLALLRPYFRDLAQLEGLYRQRVADVLLDALRDEQDEGRRARLVAMLQQYAPGSHAAAYRRAADYRRAQPAAEHFRRAARRGDRAMAEAALRQVDACLGGGLPQDLKDAWRGLPSEQPESLDGLAEALEAVNTGEFQTASSLLKSLLLDGAAESTARVHLRLDAARKLAQTRDRLAADDWTAAVACLRQVLSREPHNEQALRLLLTVEVLRADLPATATLDAVRHGVQAIRAYAAGDGAACRAHGRVLQQWLPADGLLQHLLGPRRVDAER